MKIAINENVPQVIINRLGKLGYETRDIKKVMSTAEDEEVVKNVLLKREVMVTRDKDYLDLSEKYPKLRLVLLRFFNVNYKNASYVADFLHVSGCMERKERVVVVRWEGEVVSIERDGILEGEGKK